MALALKATKIVDTSRKLVNRIEERFPDSSLLALCKALRTTAEQTRRRANRVSRPYYGLRATVYLVLASAVAGIGWMTFGPLADGKLLTDVDLLDPGTLESTANLLIIAGSATFFLVSVEERTRRRQILAQLHELRSLAHIVDMHQLTKDPTALLDASARTPSSPERNLTAFQLGRYLDYCTEMLAIIGKLAAIYGERSRDAQVVAAVNDIESLTSGLGRKIWQKIMLLHDPGSEPTRVSGTPVPPIGELPTRIR